MASRPSSSEKMSLISLLTFVVTATLASAFNQHRLQHTGHVFRWDDCEGGGSGTLVKFNPTGREGVEGYDATNTLVGCLTAAHVCDGGIGNLRLTRSRKGDVILKPWGPKDSQGRANPGGFSFRGCAKDNENRCRGGDWMFYGLATYAGRQITEENVEELVGVTPYWLEYSKAPHKTEEGSPLSNVFYLHDTNKIAYRTETAPEQHTAQRLTILEAFNHKTDKPGMFKADGRLGGGASGSPYYDSDWNLVGIHRGFAKDKQGQKTLSILTGINLILDGFEYDSIKYTGLRDDVLNYLAKRG